MDQMLLPGKVCTKCGEWKSLDRFAPRVGRPLGVQSACRDCQYEAQRQRRKTRGDEVRQRDRNAYASREHLREHAKKYRRANLSKYAEWQRQWRANNPGKVAELNKRRRVEPKTKQPSTFDPIAYRKKWAAENKDRIREHRVNSFHRRRARMHQAGVYKVTKKDLRRILSYGCAVAECTNTNLHLDHIIPVARGGSHGIGNLQALCATHNRIKSARLPIEFRVHLQRLAAQPTTKEH